jgi:hypothetical protein
VDVDPVLVTRNRIRGDAACEELRAHGIKCDCVEPQTPYVSMGYVGDVPFHVIVAPEDAERARQVIDAWSKGGA